MPFKANASCRHYIPKQRHRVRNWAEYDAGLRAGGSLTVWFTPEAVERWRAITAALTCALCSGCRCARPEAWPAPSSSCSVWSLPFPSPLGPAQLPFHH